MINNGKTFKTAIPWWLSVVTAVAGVQSLAQEPPHASAKNRKKNLNNR